MAGLNYEEQEQFDTAYQAAELDAELNAKQNTEDTRYASYYQFVTPLAIKLQGIYSEAQGQRRDQELIWVKDLQQYRGEYSDTIKARIHPKRSQAFMRLTRTKVKSVDARMLDILFPTNGDKHWGTETTPVPDMSEAEKQQYALIYAEQTGQEPTPDAVDAILVEVAREKALRMEKEMEDQLCDLSYRTIVKQVIHSGNLYGTGILKGPLARVKEKSRWVDTPEGWVVEKEAETLPYCEFVPLWDVYPDMSAREPDEMRYIVQRYIMNKAKVVDLAKRDDFDGTRIMQYVREHYIGDSTPVEHETYLREMSPGGNVPAKSQASGRYDVLEFWIQLDIDELRQEGVEIPEEVANPVMMANIWMIGPLIIKVVLSPMEGMNFPYHFYYYDKDETCIFGEGLAAIMRDPQSMLNASVRAMLDNAAISAGPIIEANIELLSPGEDPRDIYPFRVFPREGVGSDAAYPALRITNITSHTNELMALTQFFQSVADEVTTVPRYMYGEASNISGAGRTASGLSMLMGSANITMKDQIKAFDDGVTTPFITALYFWNMQFNPKQEIKGDYSIVATGSTSLVAKEVRAEHLTTFLSLTNNAVDMMYTHRDAVLREISKVLDLDDLKLIKSPQQVKAEQQQHAINQQNIQAQMMDLARLKAQSGGHLGNDDPVRQMGGMSLGE